MLIDQDAITDPLNRRRLHVQLCGQGSRASALLGWGKAWSAASTAASRVGEGGWAGPATQGWVAPCAFKLCPGLLVSL